MKQWATIQCTSAGCEAAQSSQQICQTHVCLVKVVLGTRLLLARCGQNRGNANVHEKVTFSFSQEEGGVPSQGAFPNKRALQSSMPCPHYSSGQLLFIHRILPVLPVIPSLIS